MAIFLTADSAFIAVTIFIFGLSFGSFLNVCIYRLPRGLSLLPGSACPKCAQPIKPYYNVPVFGWLVLRGRCSECKKPISSRYAFVELAIGILFLLCYLHFGLTIDALKYSVFGFLIVGLVFTDADLHLLPDTMTLTGFWLGLAFSLLVPVGGSGWLAMHGGENIVSALPFDFQWRALSLIAALLGAAVGAGFIWAVAHAYKLLRGVEGMGFGDVKLMAMIGAFLGIKLALLTILFGSVAGSVAGASAMIAVFFKRLRRHSQHSGVNSPQQRAWASARLTLRHYEMPFGVFLGLMSLVSVVTGNRLMNWYLDLYR